jgi:2-polyprenyl-3-methyl-5-hydroxy-6-metoxy-1,4-benzoquinol methylase
MEKSRRSMDGPMFDYIERLYPKQDFMDAYWLSREATESILFEEEDVASEKAVELFPLVYAKLRFLLENYSRYEFALGLIEEGEDVIDVPCGAGYGSALLAGAGTNVFAMDLDEESIEYARDNYGYPNIEFVKGDMMHDALPEADVVVCIEGLEHITPGEALIQRFVACLRQGGRLILSVPVNEEFIRDDKDNPFHMEKYDHDKLSKLLEAYFSRVFYFGVDTLGSVSDVSHALNSIIAVCEV